MGHQPNPIVVNGVTCVAAAVKSNTMCILAAFKKMVRYLALPLVSMLETYNNVSNQVSSFFDLYQYLNTGMDVTQLKVRPTRHDN